MKPKSTKKNTAKKKPSKPTPTKTTKPAPRGPAPKKSGSKKPPAKKSAPEAPAAPKPAPVVLPPVDPEHALLALDIPGEAIDGCRLAKCIKYAARVTPKEDGVVVFTRDGKGRPLISGHDLKRSHTGYLSSQAAMHAHIQVSRDDAMELAKMLEGLSGPMVRINASGSVVIRHGVGQPPARFELGTAPITQTWRPPSQAGRDPAVGPLRMSASWQSAACKWPKAVVHNFQSADGIEFINVSDEETGELLARAVLAEDGKDIYTEEERQAEIPGSRTAGDRAVQKAAEQLKQVVAENGATITVKVVESSPVVEGPKPDAKVEDAADEIRARLGDRPANDTDTPATDADAPAQGGAAEGASA